MYCTGSGVPVGCCSVGAGGDVRKPMAVCSTFPGVAGAASSPPVWPGRGLSRSGSTSGSRGSSTRPGATGELAGISGASGDPPVVGTSSATATGSSPPETLVSAPASGKADMSASGDGGSLTVGTSSIGAFWSESVSELLFRCPSPPVASGGDPSPPVDWPRTCRDPARPCLLGAPRVFRTLAFVGRARSQRR